MIKLFFRFCIFILCLLLIYTFYKSEIYWKGENRNVYLIYFLVFTALIIFFFITSHLNYNIQQYVVIIIISVTFSLYFLEGYSYFKFKEEKKN